MIRERHSWERVIDMENCKAAVLDEAKTNRCRKSGMSALMREKTDEFAKKVRERLADGFKPHPFIEFEIHEYGKTRHIQAPDIEDAMCHRAATRILEPLVYKRMVPRSYCPVEKRGGLKLARDLKRMIARCDESCRIHNKKHKQEWKTWILESDIYHYFESITFNVAMEAMLRIFDEGAVTNYLMSCLEMSDGLPIGAGYSSMIANAILIPLDWRIVRIREVRGYARYMDDTAVVVRSKKAAQMVHEEIEDELNKIGLTTEKKWKKYPSNHHAIEMGGWRINGKAIYPSTRIEKHIRRLLKGDVRKLSEDGRAALASLYGYVKNGESMALKKLWKEKNADRVFSKVG